MYKEINNDSNSRFGISALRQWLNNKFSIAEMQKQFMVHPCNINGAATLVYERGLERNDPEAFKHLRLYASQHGYDIKEDQRQDFLEGIKRVKDKQAANLMTIMVITGCLMSPKAFAGSSGSLENTGSFAKVTSQANAQVHILDNLLDLNIHGKTNISETEMTIALLMWINKNSSFKFNLDELPKIEKVNNEEIAKIAFGKTLPAAVDPDTLGIKGLYNFHNKTIYILESLDLNLEDDRAILLHELVHFLQYQHGDDKGAKCKNELERLAYKLEAKYLDSLNHKIDFTNSHVENVSQCR